MSFQLYIFSMVWFSLPHNIFQTCMPLKFPPSSHYPPLILPISFTICFSSLSLMCLIVINLSVTSQAITFFFLYTVSFSNFHISLITSINYYVILSFDFNFYSWDSINCLKLIFSSCTSLLSTRCTRSTFREHCFSLTLSEEL